MTINITLVREGDSESRSPLRCHAWHSTSGKEAASGVPAEVSFRVAVPRLVRLLVTQTCFRGSGGSVVPVPSYFKLI